MISVASALPASTWKLPDGTKLGVMVAYPLPSMDYVFPREYIMSLLWERAYERIRNEHR